MSYVLAYLMVGALVAPLHMVVSLFLRTRLSGNEERWRSWDESCNNRPALLLAIALMALAWPLLVLGWLYSVTSFVRVLWVRRW